MANWLRDVRRCNIECRLPLEDHFRKQGSCGWLLRLHLPFRLLLEFAPRDELGVDPHIVAVLPGTLEIAEGQVSGCQRRGER
jgi:hypothetical protein